MKKLLIIFLSALSLTAVAQETKIALLQPLTVPGSTACNAMEIRMVLGELRNAFSWQSNFQVLTRMDVDAMLKEQGFQRSGMVDDAQRKKIGVMTSAQYICVSSITKYQRQLYIEAYLVDVETGRMTNSASQYVNIKNEDYSLLPDACGKLASEMLGEIGGVRKNSSNSSSRSSASSNHNQDFTEDAWGINMKMIWVEGGEFLMGCTSEQGSCEGDEQYVRHETVDGFFIGMLEVTQSQWEKVMGVNIYYQWEAADQRSMFGVGPNYPMYFVRWEDAMEFCRLLSNKTGRTYSLPTEAQWEYAARGGKKADGTKYAGSNMIDAVAWYGDNSGSSTHPCGSKRANALGIYDMSGNVWEWCMEDRSDSEYLMAEIRGGGWGDATEQCRVAYSNFCSSDYWFPNVGFRVVCLP